MAKKHEEPEKNEKEPAAPEAAKQAEAPKQPEGSKQKAESKQPDALEQAKAAAHHMGVSPGIDPFMTLSFMSLPVIPALKITTHGVFDVEQWKYI